MQDQTKKICAIAEDPTKTHIEEEEGPENSQFHKYKFNNKNPNPI